jgi:uncharacterized protein YcfJ
MDARWKAVLAAAATVASTAAMADMTFYEHPDFKGRSFTATDAVIDFGRSGFNDHVSSVIVLGDPWEACDNADFSGRCVFLWPGQYPSLSAMALDDRMSSARPFGRQPRSDDARYVPPANPAQDYRRRQNERIYLADVTAVREVLGTPGQRCWVEPRPAAQEPRDNRAPAAILGAVIGGVLGHQVGGGTGRDLATVGGAVAGAFVGANVGRGGADAEPARDVQRCSGDASSARPAYWEVTYEFRGQEHQMQMTAPPGRTVTVNEQGEPRV